MNKETASPGPSSAMFNNATGVGIDNSKFINSGQDTNYTINNVYYNFKASRIPDVINYTKTAAEPLVSLIPANQLTGADCSGPLPNTLTTEETPQSPIAEGYLVDADISKISLDPSSLPVASNADRYTRSMLQCLHGYPLYEPRPFSHSSEEYMCHGIKVGDVGYVRDSDGTFDFLFNICLPQYDSINPPNLPKGFSLETPEHSATRVITPHPRNTYIFHSPITRTKSGKYTCEGSDGAILELPEGAIQHEAVYILALRNLAARYGVEWYKYTMTQGRDIPNGSLYLITSFTKCTQWGIAIFNQRCASGQHLRFDSKFHFPFPFPFRKSTPKYHWKGSGVFTTKVADRNQQDALNQCVFLRGFKITIRPSIFDDLRNDQLRKSNTFMTSSSPQAKSSSPIHVTRQKASRIRGGGGPDPSLRRLPWGSPLTQTTDSSVTQSDEVVLHANFNSSLVHPSDFINAALLSQNPDAKVALTHDDVWCDLLRDNFPELNHATLINIARSYTSTVDEYGCIFLEKTRTSDSSNDESSSRSPTSQGPMQKECSTTPNEENTPVPTENPMPSVQEKNDNVGRAILYEVCGDTVIFQLGDGHYTEQERDMQIRDHLSNVTTFTLRDINDIMNTMKSHPLGTSILDLPNPQAAYGDYQIKNKHRPCVKGTRVPLLQKMADWISGTDETGMYVLSGSAKIGKSTIAHTIAARADALGLLGASFFFSQDSADRDNGKMFFTAIAYQLCLFNELFAKAIEAALLTKPLSDATMKDPQEQLEALILEPLRSILRSRLRPILIVVDGLDEYEEEDGLSVLTGLRQLVRDLPSFKVILTTRPQSYFDRFSQDDHKIFHVEHIEEDDTLSYHKPSLSVGEQSQERGEGVHASDTRVGSLVRTIEKLIPRMDVSIPFSDNFNTENSDEAREGEDPNFPAVAPAITTDLHSVDRGDRTVQGGEAPAVSFFQGSSNVEMTGSNSIPFGDGRFTDIQRNLICDYIANLTMLPDINDNLKKYILTQSIRSLPRAEAVFNNNRTKKSGPCFKGTRVALLREMADWATGPDESRMYILSGLAGIGKSTVAYTIASRAADLGLLGASFFFSRDEADCMNAEKVFSTIAYQLCVYNETFAKAIGDMLLTERGSAATTKDPQEQLQVLIVEPLRILVRSRSRPIFIVVDALDECDEDDVFSVLTGLRQLVQDLPLFKVILTTRPQPCLDRFLHSQDGLPIFHLQNIEDKIVSGDIRLYLQHCLSLEEIQKHYPKRQWCASDEGIDSLVHTAGRLFIIASTAVRYIFDKSASNPAAQMQKLLSAFTQAYTPFKDLDRLYTVTLRNAVPADCDDDDIVDHYQSVVGAIISVQRPLPVSKLAHLINMDVDDIRAVLDNLQSVILLESDDVPRICHKSFSDYLTDEARCKDPRLRIDTRIHHMQIVIRCFGIMDKHLKRNILGLSDPARFMSNEDGLKGDGITEEQLQEKIPQQLRYACVYWANHFELANTEDVDLMNRLEKFVIEHMLYWFEVLSLIENLDSAHRAIRVVLKLLKSTSLDLHQLLLDALRFISKFYETIKRSALHAYYSALPFTPRDSLFYHRYIKDAVHNICGIEGGPEKWDALVANLSHGEQVVVVKFSPDSTVFVSCSQRNSKIWDTATGTPISTIRGHRFAVADDFSTVASSEGETITFYNVNGSARGTVITSSLKIQKLALSSENSRVAAALSDGTVRLWDSENAESIHSFDGFESTNWPRLQFSPTGTRLAFSSASGIKLRDGISGRFIANLRCGPSYKFEFSGDGSRIVSVSPDDCLTLWNSESGGLIAAVTEVGQHGLAISANGFLLATADANQVKLWSENHGHLAQIKDLQLDMPHDMAFSLDNILAIATFSGMKLYNTDTHFFIHTLPFGGSSAALTFSPDCTRLVVGDDNGNVNLWDIRGIDPSKAEASGVTVLTLSRDCSQLACGFEDGTVELWGTNPSKRRIASHQAHERSVRALGFGPGGRLFASGSDDGTIKLWNGGDGSLRGTQEGPRTSQAVALSNSVLVAAGNGGVTLWSLDTLRLIHTFKEYGDKVSIAENNVLIAVSRDRAVSLLDVVNCTTIATFDVPYTIDTMTFLPDNSQLVTQSREGVFQSLNLVNDHATEDTTLEHLIQLPNAPQWRGVPIWHCQDKEQHYVSALFSQHNAHVPLLWIPKDLRVMTWTQGSSMIALGCKDGGVILLRLPTATSHVG